MSDLVCPRCGDPLDGVRFYGPCATCRDTLKRDAAANAWLRACVVAALLDAGYTVNENHEFEAPDNEDDTVAVIASDRAGAPTRRPA